MLTDAEYLNDKAKTSDWSIEYKEEIKIIAYKILIIIK